MHELNVDVRKHGIRAANRNGGTGRLEELERGEPEPHSPDEPYPYLEAIMVAAKQNPNAAIGLMIGIASLVIGTCVTIALAAFGGMFLMYGEMTKNTALLNQVIAAQAVTQQKQDEDGKVMRAYASVNGKRVEFIIGTLPADVQERINQYDRAHPDPLLPDPKRNQ